MSRSTVTVFVRDIGDGFAASTFRTDAFAPSEDDAAKRAGARFFGVPVERIELLDDPTDPHVRIAVKTETPRDREALLWRAIAILVATALVCVLIILLAGGVQ